MAHLPTNFREIHKQNWLKRCFSGAKKSDRCWVVFCIHDDTEALLEGYTEPRHASSHCPDWIVSMQDTLHISHALIPNSHEFEFVITLSNEVIRFHAMSWEIMVEWVEALRAKLREMKILSPRENVYTKLPEIRAPLLPTRDPNSPLPAPPPVPAAIVPGIERIPHSNISAVSLPIDQTTQITSTSPPAPTPVQQTNDSNILPSSSNINTNLPTITMSNTLSQNLLNLLSDPISTYNEHLNEDSLNNDFENVDLLEEEDSLSGFCEELLSTVPQQSILENSCSILSNDSTESGQLPPQSRINSRQISAEEIEVVVHPTRVITRPQTSLSESVEKADIHQNANIMNSSVTNNTSNGNNITELEIHTKPINLPISSEEALNSDTSLAESKTNITIIQVSTNLNTSSEDSPQKLPSKTTADLFQFPEATLCLKMPQKQQYEYKSNVQIIPSNLNNSLSQIQVVPTHHHNTRDNKTRDTSIGTSLNISAENQKITTVLLGGDSSILPSVSQYGTCFSTNTNSALRTPEMPKKIFLCANTSGITNIAVNNGSNITSNTPKTAELENIECTYDKVFLFSSIPVSTSEESSASSLVKRNSNVSPVLSTQPSSSNQDCELPAITQIEGAVETLNVTSDLPSHESADYVPIHTSTSSRTNTDPIVIAVQENINSPIGNQRSIESPSKKLSKSSENAVSSHNRQLLKRGLTVAVISRPSRKDGHVRRQSPKNSKASLPSTNNNSEQPSTSAAANEHNRLNSAINRTHTDILEQRRRSSSTSDAQAHRNNRGVNNNEFPRSAIRIQQPPQPFRIDFENGDNRLSHTTNSPATKRMTLREQQVIQLRREIAHVGGVRFQLRRKDCLGSIAWVDSFGAVWVAGWKQKEHPVLYNALHIGDRLVSIAGNAITSAADANKIIRNTNTLFIEVLVRRVPFGRCYAIRRDREGQCLGLIRDGNTATIVDVIPNSLACRHGLPPKAQSCDASTLTFWVLTEINGRPLNLFAKDNEIRDRLNSVGRDISLLVQPADLMTKLKKQLKSQRGYKDYVFQ